MERPLFISEKEAAKLTPDEIVHYQSANHPMNNTGLVGGACSASPVSTDLGGIFHSVVPNAAETDPTLYQYKKTFLKNESSSENLTSAKVYLLNGLADVASNGVVTLDPSSASDDNTKTAWVVGEDGSSLVQEEYIVLNGTTSVSGTKTFTKVFFVIIISSSGGTPVNAAADILFAVNSVTLGIIPGNKYSANAVVDIGLPATLNDTVTTTNATTAPSEISFSRPTSYSAGIAVATDALTYGDATGIWWRLSVEGGLPGLSQCQADLWIKGTL